MELNYFCTRIISPKIAPNLMEGERWLQARFSHCEDAQIRGEIRVGYLVDPGPPMLIHQHSPSPEIIASYRRPTNALYSPFCQLAKNRAVVPTCEEFLHEHQRSVEYGFYRTHTPRFLQVFSQDSSHFIILDDICVDPERVIVDLFAFLEIDSGCRPVSLHRRVDTRKAPRSIPLRNTIGPARNLVNRSHPTLWLSRTVRCLGPSRASDGLGVMNLRENSFRPRNKDTRARVQTVLTKGTLCCSDFSAET
jgi:hypothetical protein